ncbi:hypothetical protein CY34DRAFT_807452 [Suillus luteus UH-Slu-Lm8-n1]|uniref:Unplaced genomic scaffold CY34scaffold_180, whole genome shotgun sequence n=1 Tax=Suillus luteus UH-Slu-Lm8-n1 TaxID=930992 RepID=A0A0D0AEV0_9AGAM|nr:hypothetical protein CY34DRAFT_807452 [Suillus luteus UH-Slu-Lm8-n1]
MRCGRMQQDETEFRFAGVVRKQLGLTFSGETRDNFHITGDIRLKGVGLERASYLTGAQRMEHWEKIFKSVIHAGELTYHELCP